jgi:HAE1 family hydrophobic/amphiphilic exporter-1
MSSSPISPLPASETGITGYFSRIRIVILIALILSGAGLASYATLTKELNPNIQIPIVFVTTILPGSDPEDMEQLITIPIEDALENLSDVTKTTSTSQESVSHITLEFASGTDPDKAKNDVQSALDSVTVLPKDAEKPNVQVLDFQNQPSLILAITDRDGEQASLEHFTDALEKAVKDLPGVERVSLGYRNDPVARIALTPELVDTYHLSLPILGANIGGALDNYPSGSLRTETTKYTLGIEKLADSMEELRSLPISLGDTVVPLGSVAEITEHAPLGSTEAFFADQNTSPVPTILLSAFKSDSADTRTTVDSILKTAHSLSEREGGHIILSALFDGGQEISKSFDQLLHDFLLTFLLVFLVLLTFFGFRQSIVAALAIPITFLGTFLVMKLSGLSINFISLFSLLLALGILVDNAIVIVSAVSSRRRAFTDEDPMQTALHVFADYRIVILTTTITTVWAFLPLLLASGIIGEFIKPIPIVVSTALALSALIALFIILPFMAALLAGGAPFRVKVFSKTLAVIALITFLFWYAKGSLFFIPVLLAFLVSLVIIGLSFSTVFRRFMASPSLMTGFSRLAVIRSQLNLDRVASRYEIFIRRILVSKRLRRRTFTMLILFSLFSYVLVPTGYVVNEFFPEDDQSIIYVRLKLPVGTSLEESRKSAIDLAETLRHETLVNFVVSEIGAKPPTDNSPSSPDTNEILFTLILPDKKDRDETSGSVVERLNRKYASFNTGEISATQVSGGPPAGSDITLKLLGSDLEALDGIAKTIQAHLKETPSVTNISSSLSVKGKMVFVPDTEALAHFGVPTDEFALALRTLGNGFTVKNDARFEDRKMDVEIALTDDPKGASLSDPDRIFVNGSTGTVPLSALGHFVLKENPASIDREDGKRVISVTADVAPGYSVSTESKNLESYAKDDVSFPDGYSFQTGGVNEENTKSVRSILLAMLLSAALIFATMVMQFNSFRKAIIVLLVIPLAVSGVFVIFALFGVPLSFPALIGVLALFGIVVNNSIIMVDKINKNMERMPDLDSAIASGAASRLEPILLTALTTIIGLIPITLSDPIWQGLGGAIIAGLTFSGVAKLFFIPVIYKSWFDTK